MLLCYWYNVGILETRNANIYILYMRTVREGNTLRLYEANTRPYRMRGGCEEDRASGEP